MIPGAVKAIAKTAKSGSTCTADIAGVVTTIEVARDLTVAAGDGLLVLKVGQLWYAVARFGTAAPAALPEAAPTAPTTPQSGTLNVSPVETRSYRNGSWRTDNDDVYQGSFGSGNHTGCVFYGTKPRSLAGATVTKATLRIRRPDKGGANAAQDTTLWLVTQATRPSGAPARTSSTDGPNLRRGETQSGISIPTSWAQAMVDGTAGGLAVYESDGSPYVILAGRGSYGPAFTLTLDWTR